MHSHLVSEGEVLSARSAASEARDNWLLTTFTLNRAVRGSWSPMWRRGARARACAHAAACWRVGYVRVCQGAPVCSRRDWRVLRPSQETWGSASGCEAQRVWLSEIHHRHAPHCPVSTGLCVNDSFSLERPKPGPWNNHISVPFFFFFTQTYHCVAASLGLSVCTPLFIVLGRMRIGSQALVALATPV